MATSQSYPRRRSTESRAARGANPGVCMDCGNMSAWRSINNRCWQCEMSAMKKRPPVFIERDILVMTTPKSEE